MSGLHKPMYDSLKKFLEAKVIRHSEFDFKFQIDQELWVKHFEAVARGDIYRRVRNRKAYEVAADKMRSCEIVSQDSIERFWAYKKGCDKCTYDCDGTAGNGTRELYINYLMREIYRTLWGWMDGHDGGEGNPEDRAVRRYGCCKPEYTGDALSLPMGPDTMNSMWMPLANYLILTYNDLFGGKGSSYWCKKEEDRKLTLPELIRKYDLKIDAEVKKFAALTHAMGNMVLVPKGFNTFRSIRFRDFWDLSLKNLDGTEFLRGSIIPYINVFFLWDYIKEDGTVGELCEREEGRIFPGRESCRAFFSNVNGCITNRGEFMYQMLCLAQDSPEKYREIIRAFSEEKVIMSDERISEISGIRYNRKEIHGK